MTAPTMRTWAEIDLSALRHNFNVARSAGANVMCVIKANGYGHGAVRLGQCLEQAGASAFAVATLGEAVAMREAGISRMLLVLGYTPAQYASDFAHYRLAATIVDKAAAADMSRAAKNLGITVPVHIKVDTGMSRLGFLTQSPQEIALAVKEIAACADMEGLDLQGIYTHFSAADTSAENDYTNLQIRRFRQVLDGLEKRKVHIPIRHAANSAAILRHPDARFDMVREGIMLYGLYPDNRPDVSGLLRPVMTLKTRVAQIKEFGEGTTIGYGRTFRANQPTRVAVLCAGYADGYPRRLSNQGMVYIGGKACPQIGRICMDMCMADVTGLDIKRGDEAVLFGQGGSSLEEVSQIAGTINYELACLVTGRVHRVYLEP